MITFDRLLAEYDEACAQLLALRPTDRGYESRRLVWIRAREALRAFVRSQV